jgi:hypothetical protein
MYDGVPMTRLACICGGSRLSVTVGMSSSGLDARGRSTTVDGWLGSPLASRRAPPVSMVASSARASSSGGSAVGPLCDEPARRLRGVGAPRAFPPF